MTEQELNVLNRVQDEMLSATTVDQINKIYRQARNWSRYHCFFEHQEGLPQKCTELNIAFKSMRDEALAQIGGVSCEA